MQWRNQREKELGVELGFIVSSVGGASARIVNVLFPPGDEGHNSPLQGNVRPASSAECKMWRLLMKSTIA
jgi:hypothetical protein